MALVVQFFRSQQVQLRGGAEQYQVYWQAAALQVTVLMVGRKTRLQHAYL